jgi:hypothetical protein
MMILSKRVKKWRAPILSASFAAIFAPALGAAPALAFYCGHALVKEGDYVPQVAQKCGEPDYRSSHVELRSVRLGSGYNQPGLDLFNTVQVNVDEWTYDFGPHYLMQFLTFENGRLVSIRTLGYGTVNGAPP